MSIKFEKVRPGMTLYSKERRKMGHTTMSETVAVAHYVQIVDAASRVVVVSRQGREKAIPERRLKSLSAKNPTCPKCRKVGGHRYDCATVAARKEEGA